MIYIVPAYDSDENNTWADFAWIEVTPELITRLKLLKEKSVGLGKDVGAWATLFWDTSATFFHLDNMEEGDLDSDTWGLLENVRETESYVALDEMPEDLAKFLAEGNEERYGFKTVPNTDGDLVKVYADENWGLRWEANVKHTEIKVWTQEIRINELEEVLHGEPGSEIREGVPVGDAAGE